MTVKVKEAQYKIGRKGTSDSKLVTQNIANCIAFSGIDEQSGVVFLCHINSRACARNLVPQIVDDLKARGASLDRFTLYTSSGLRPWPLIMVIAGALALAGGYHLLSYLNAALSAAMAGLALLAPQIGKRHALWQELQRLNAFNVEPKFQGYAFNWPFFLRSRVTIDANLKRPPEVEAYRKNAEDRDYAPPSDPSIRKTESSD